jgi:ABC-type transporter Mla maintaining outer membrane lipid asymmetry permease subunit MlaE
MSNVPPYNPPPPPIGSTPGGNPSVISHPKGTSILVFGILSLVCCPPLGILAFINGNTALAEMNANPGMVYANRSSITTGRILGIIGIAIAIIGAVGSSINFLVR